MSETLFVVRDRRWLIDLIITVAVTCLTAAVFFVTDYRPSLLDNREGLLALALCSALLVRRTIPPLAVAWASVAALAQAVLLPSPAFSIIVVPMVVYAATRWSTRRVGTAALLLGLSGAVIGPFRWTAPGLAVSPITAFAVSATACASIIAGSYLLGRRLADQQDNLRQRRMADDERQRLQQAEAEQRSRAVAMDERSRIARELHDIVAHSLSVMIVQAEGGRAIATKRPEAAARVLTTIAETGRTALGEMRQIVDLLRGDSRPGTEYLPSPGLADIAELVQRTGDRVGLQVQGTPPTVAPTVGLTAYRIVQESLTNVLKHAGPAASARVILTYTDRTVQIEVSDDGRGAAARPGTGYGLRGMDERVTVVGGQLWAGPRPGGGFTVRAQLPLEVRP